MKVEKISLLVHMLDAPNFFTTLNFRSDTKRKLSGQMEDRVQLLGSSTDFR